MAKVKSKSHDSAEVVNESSALSNGDTGPVEIIWINILENKRTDEYGVLESIKRVYFTTRDSTNSTAPLEGFFFNLVGNRAWLDAIINAFENGTYVNVTSNTDNVTFNKNDAFSEVAYFYRRERHNIIHFKVTQIT